ncbi:MAG: hypothetical protein IH621_06355, partial [Krumholzibacteria bacterium]|nr:hypothetical protein [Candidatus Krumholzibacteria bacterium]
VALPVPLRWAAAAAFAAAVLSVVGVFDRGGGPGLVWADVIARVEQADAYICRRIERRTGDKDQEIIEYRSARFGLRQDIYQDGRLQAAQYIVPAERMLYSLVHRDRTYLRQHLGEDQVAEILRQSSAQEIVRSFRDDEHRSLGRRRIERRQAEGIELTDFDAWAPVFESGSLRLWVDLETQWPVRLELEGTARGGKVRKTIILDNFQWNPALAAADFAVTIPDHYRLIGDLPEVRATEDQALDALRRYAGLTGGRYPSALSLVTAIAEAEAELDRRHDRYDEAAGRDLEDLMAIRDACFFFRELETAGRDAAYHGGEVTIRDFGRILMRWRLDDGRYRVVWGDLRVETVATGRLAELEGRR